MARTVTDVDIRGRVPVRDIDRQEGRAVIDENARHYLGISGEEFLRRWNSGEYAHADDDPNVMLVASLLPFIR